MSCSWLKRLKSFHNCQLQPKIWELSYQRLSIHIFDVCFPKPGDSSQKTARQAFTDFDGVFNEKRDYETYGDKIFLESLDISSSIDGISTTRFTSDPSEYTTTNALSLICIDAARAIRANMHNGRGRKNNVYLPGKGQKVFSDNIVDVLCLRFGTYNGFQDSTSTFTEDDRLAFPNNISHVLQGRWSEGMATTLYAARRIAIDISELWSPSELDLSMVFEIASCCSCIQHDLEVLYLIDYCVGRCRQCRKRKMKSKEIQRRKCDLAKELDPNDREMDIIYGTRVIYREICDLEGLGWCFEHPVFMLAKIISGIIREQQGDDGPFRSVRVLACDEEVYDGEDRIVCIACNVDDR